MARWWPLREKALLAQVVAAYADPARGYHDLEHLREVLDRIDEITGAEPLALDLGVVRLAAFFHDVVYDTAPDDGQSNEEASARWALAALTGAAPLVEPERADRVAALVRATSGHRADADDLEAAVLLDADLGILAAPPDRYARYVQGVRREYAAVPDQQFREGRAAVLRDLVGREHLFHTAYGRRAWEHAARANVARELAALRGEAG